MKILLIILGVVLIAFGLVFYYYGPYSEAARGGIKGKPKKSPTSTTTTTPTPATTLSPSPTTTPSTAILFSDDFSGDLSQWQIAWDGYGTIKIENGTLMTAPQVSTSPGETHSALVTSGNTSWGDYVYNLRMNTTAQLRTGSSPNHWEVGWLTFRHQDNNRFYYFILKPNGIELGKALGNDQQVFFVTESNPKLQLGQWNDFKIALKGANIKVYINDSLVANYTDDNNPFLTGGIGLYNEDAKVYYDDVSVTSN